MEGVAALTLRAETTLPYVTRYGKVLLYAECVRHAAVVSSLKVKMFHAKTLFYHCTGHLLLPKSHSWLVCSSNQSRKTTCVGPWCDGGSTSLHSFFSDEDIAAAFSFCGLLSERDVRGICPSLRVR